MGEASNDWKGESFLRIDPSRSKEESHTLKKVLFLRRRAARIRADREARAAVRKSVGKGGNDNG